MARPAVSVILRTRDRPLLLREALASLRAQTFRDFETLVIADDGAKPPEELLSPAPGDGGLKLVHREPPHGRSLALNAGLDAAAGRFIAYLDDDDIYHPDHLETLARFLSGGTYRVAYTDVEQITQTLGPDGLYHDGDSLFIYGRPFERDRLLSSNYISLIGLMHAATDQRYDENFDLLEDWDFMIRLAERERFHRIAKVTAVYRVRDDQSNATTTTPWHGVEAESARRKLFEKHWQRQNVDSQMGLVDSFQAETWLLRSERAEATRQQRLTTEELLRRAHAERELALNAAREEAAQLVRAAGEREAALAAESARHVHAAAEREAALAAEMSRQLQAAAEREAALATEMTRSTTRMSELHQQLQARAEAELESALLAVREEAWQQLHAAAMRERELATELESTAGQLSAVRQELGAVRGDAWRQLQAAGEREKALSAAWQETSRYLQAAGENERVLLATLQEIYGSTSWKLLAPYFRFKAWLQRR